MRWAIIETQVVRRFDAVVLPVKMLQILPSRVEWVGLVSLKFPSHMPSFQLVLVLIYHYLLG
jgi:hypothetical protein